MRSDTVKTLARECGFELAGVCRAEPVSEFAFYQDWVQAGFAGTMSYLTDHRAALRRDPRSLLPSARSVVCVGLQYNGPEPYSTRFNNPERAWISRYAWGDDYHAVLRRRLEQLAAELQLAFGAFEWRIAVDTAPLLERAFARRAGLGWIGKNSCLINQTSGSWFFLGELLTSLELEPDTPAPDRCGSCTRCIEACPTRAIVPAPAGGPAWTIDSRSCISYLTIELRGAMPPEHRAGVGSHVFGCDICQDVCPWNRRASVDRPTDFSPQWFAPPLERLALISELEFREMFRHSPVRRARYNGFLRNVIVAMGNSGSERCRPILAKLSESHEPPIAEHARWALQQIP